MNLNEKKYRYGNLLIRLYPHKSLLLCFLLISCLLTAQQSPVKFTHLTNLDGLSRSTVKVMLKDKYGFMWFGTQEGLNRYDGYNFKVYRHQVKDSHSLRRSNIISLHEDRQGVLWVGTANGALSMYDRKHDCFVHYKESSGDFAGLSQASVTAIYEDKQDNLWVGTYWKLNLLDRKTGKVTQFGHDSKDDESISSDGVSCVLEDSKNNLWIGTSGGLNLLNRKTNKFTHYLHRDDDPLSISDDGITVIKEDSLGRLWIGTKNGLNLFNRENGSFSRFTHDPADVASLGNNQISAIENEENGKLWIGTSNVLDIFDTDKRTFNHFYNNPDDPASLAVNASVSSMLRDKEGILWVGTSQGGINKYDKYLTYFDVYRNHSSDPRSVSFNTITGFAEKPDGDIWISTSGGALNLWERPTGYFKRFNPDPRSKDSLANWGLLCLAQSKKTNYLYIGSYGSGMDRYDSKARIFKHYTKGDSATQLNNDAVYAIFEDSKGNIWMGTNGGGINVLNDSTGIITKYVNDPNNPNTPSGNFIRCFYEDKKGRVWAGSSTGISQYDPVKKIFTRYDLSNTALESDMITCLYGDKHGNIWVGTIGGGLNLLDPDTKKLVIYTVDDGLPDNTINSIIEDDNGYLWLSTNNGISRFDTQKKFFKNSGLYNGIQSFEFSLGAGLKTSKGEILFGGVNGFNAFNPSNLVENRNIPPIVFTDFKVFNKSVTVDEPGSPLKENIGQTKELTLSYQQSIFTIEFAALGFTAPEKNQYSFMLEGVDKKWNTGFQRSATYTNLDAGEYTFRVKASNNDGWWS
ncbi:MAG: two-component regulator propeller domain-containing protein, partial [Sediminibacterium sp.]